MINNRVSQQQIHLATTSTIYSSVLGDDLVCPISMDTIGDGDSVIQIRECGHRFKTEPLLNWFTRNSHCPVCRYDILDYRESDQEQVPEPEPEPGPEPDLESGR